MSLPGQVLVAWGSTAVLAASQTYKDISSYITGYSVRRGRQYLTDRTEAGTCDLAFIDKDGKLDPTNTGSTWYPLNPNVPAQVKLLNPVTGNQVQIFQGHVQGIPQTVRDQATAANRGSIPLVDLFSILALNELPPATDFSTGGTGASASNVTGNITYAEETVQDRIKSILADAGIPTALTNIFTGNVRVQQTTYAPGYSSLAAIQDAADAEFPGVANFFISSGGTATFFGRLARFDPSTYGLHTWKLGSKEAVAGDSGMALLAQNDLAIDRDVTKIINSALFCPKGISDADIAGQLISDTASIAQYGSRAITGTDLLTAGGVTGSIYEGDPLGETRLFGTYYVDNFKDPATRIAKATLRPVSVVAANASAHWNMICNVEIGDRAVITAATPYGTGFSGSTYYIEGIEYDVGPSGLDHGVMVPNVTLTLDLSPAAYYTTEPAHWAGTA